MSKREPVDSANDAKTYAMRGDVNKAIAALADAIQGVAERQASIKGDIVKIKRTMGIS